MVIFSSQSVYAQNIEADRDLRFANQMLAKARYSTAASYYSDFLENYPNHARASQARWGLARSYEYMEDKKAAEAYNSYLTHHPGGPHAKDALMALARSLYSAAQWSEARATYNEYQTRYPSDPQTGTALYYEGLCLNRMGRPLKAIEVLAEASKLLTGRMKAEAAFQSAAAYYRAKKYGDAAEALSVVAATHEGSPAAYKAEGLLGDILYTQGDYADAYDRYQNALKGKLSYEDELSFWKAFSAIKKGDTNLGIKELIQLAENFPSSKRATAALRQAADFSLQSKNTQEAKLALNKFLSLPGLTSQDRATGLYNLGQLHYEAQNFKNAEGPLLEVINLNSGFEAEAEYILGLIALAKSANDEAEAFLRSAEARALGSDLEVSILIAMLDLASAQSSPDDYKALEVRIRTLDESVLPEVFLKGAELLEASGNEDGAEREYRKVISQYPQSTEATTALYSLGVISYAQAKYPEAERFFQDFLARTENLPDLENFVDDAWYWIGFSRYQQKQMTTAIDAFLNCAAVPGSDKALPALLRAGDAAFTLQKYQDAISYYDELIASPAADSQLYLDALYNKATSLRDLGKVPEARHAFLETFKQGGTFYEDALFKAAECLQDGGKITEAADEYEANFDKFQTLSRKEETLYRAAGLRAELNEMDLALSLYSRVGIGGGAMAPDAWYKAGAILLRSNDTQAASASFRTACSLYPATVYGRRSCLALAKLETSLDTAEYLFKSIIATAPNDPVSASAYLGLGIIEQKKNNIDSAVVLLKKSIETLPEDENLAEAKIHMAEIFLMKENFKSARRQAEYVFWSPDFEESRFRFQAGIILVKALIGVKHTTEAINILDELADNYPEEAKAVEMLRTQLP
ncbi:MAG: tetratricopeptide repeat protein [Candidatus Lindowbacteria bacterium]|nr:tetratricopeptide repeat protein [Candidatus Lindowbacteria bacterium]